MLFANSIGAWFSMPALAKEKLQGTLFVSPVVDMPALILDMRGWADVSEAQLAQERVIPTAFGQTLSWKYLQYARAHSICEWNISKGILYDEHGALIKRAAADAFCEKHRCELTVMQDGEHWFHTPQQ